MKTLREMMDLVEAAEQGVADDSMDPNAKPNKVDRKKEPNTRSERYYKNKEEKKKQGAAEEQDLEEASDEAIQKIDELFRD